MTLLNIINNLKRVLILSDLHLGDKTGSDDFSYSDFRLIKTAEKNLIARIQNVNPDILILAGDVQELLQHKESIIKRLYKNFFEYCDTLEWYYLKGNHDWTTKSTSLIELCLVLPNGKTVYIAHGHQNDPNMRNPVGKFLVWLLGGIEKVIPPIENILLKLLIKPGKSSVETLAYKFALEKLEEYDYVILGHTHQVGSKGQYFNTGTCQSGAFEGVLIQGSLISFL